MFVKPFDIGSLVSSFLCIVVVLGFSTDIWKNQCERKSGHIGLCIQCFIYVIN